MERRKRLHWTLVSYSNGNGGGEFPSFHLFPDPPNILQGFKASLNKFFFYLSIFKDLDNKKVSMSGQLY